MFCHWSWCCSCWYRGCRCLLSVGTISNLKKRKSRASVSFQHFYPTKRSSSRTFLLVVTSQTGGTSWMNMQDLEDCSEMLKLASRCCVVHSCFHLYDKFMYVIFVIECVYVPQFHFVVCTDTMSGCPCHPVTENIGLGLGLLIYSI